MMEAVAVVIRGLADSCVDGCVGSFVEVVGTKSGDASLNVVGVVGLGEQVDGELWDGAVSMMGRHCLV